MLVGRREDRLRAVAEEIGGEYEVCDVATATRSGGWRRPSGNATRSSGCSSTTRALPGAATSSTCRPGADRGARPDQLPRVGLVPAGPAAGARGGRAVARREHRLGRRHRRDRAVLGVEARAARLLALGRERAAAAAGSTCTRSTRASCTRRASRRTGCCEAASAGSSSARTWSRIDRARDRARPARDLRAALVPRRRARAGDRARRLPPRPPRTSRTR